MTFWADSMWGRNKTKILLERSQTNKTIVNNVDQKVEFTLLYDTRDTNST